MRIYYFSDLHLDYAFGYFENGLKKFITRQLRNIKSEDDSILLIAGDVFEYHRRDDFDWFFRWCEETFSKTLIILGNHGYYNVAEPDKYLNSFEYKKYKNVIFCNNKKYTINDVDIICSNLWSHVRPNNSLYVSRSLGDYKVIKDYTIEKNNTQHIIDKTFIKDNINKDRTTVVMSHHLPCSRSIEPKFKTSPVTDAFYSDSTELFDDVDIWIHGHTHSSCDYELYDTKVLCNPQGYVSNKIENIFFDANKYIEV